MADSESVSVAILHDRFPSVGGAEKVAIELARIFDAPILTTYVNQDIELPNDIDVTEFCHNKYQENVKSFIFREIPIIQSLSLIVDLSSPTEEILDYDVVIETNNFSKHYVPAEEQTIIHYTHTPPRRLYDLYHDRLDTVGSSAKRLIKRGWVKTLKIFDKEGIDYVDLFLANSEIVQNRIESYYGRGSALLYPPVTGDWYNKGDDGYFVTWSRLVPEKRTALIAEAFTELDEELVIAGDGPEREKIESIAAGHENISVRGYVEDIQSLVASASAVIYAPKNEDFGLVGAEALSAGKPLLGVNEGYTKHQVSEKTGALFEPSVESVRATVRAFDASEYDTEAIKFEAEKYTYEKFEQGIIDTIAELEDTNR